MEGDGKIEDSGTQFGKTVCVTILLVHGSSAENEGFVGIYIEQEINVAENPWKGGQCGHDNGVEVDICRI